MKAKRSIVPLALLVLVACAGAGLGADPASPAAGHDWPMWRHDAARTGATSRELPSELHLQWVRHYPALEPAWSGVRDLSVPKDRSVGFEVVYSPIVMGDTMFVGSPRNDSLTALDAATGAERWRFYTEGPVRLAPAGWRGKVYVASDDGCLYCVDAAEGKLVWKFRGAPRAYRIVGDERLISAWPARGGPVVADGTVYFAASIFPFMGIYVYALDAETGAQVWTNDERGAHWDWSGEKTSPQGPLAAVGDRLLIPNNRQNVTCLDRATGAFKYNPRTGSHWRVCGAGDHYIVESRGERTAAMHALETGELVGPVPGFPVTAGGTIFWADPYGTKAVCAAEVTAVAAAGKKKISPSWSMKIGEAVPSPFRVRIKAGARLYVTGGSRVAAVEVPANGGGPRVSWTGEVEGRVGEVLAAAGRLYVVTHEGGIYCFGAEKTAPKTHPVAKAAPAAPADAWTARAGAILKTAGVRDGYALVLGIGSGRLLEELVAQSSLHVVGIGPDAGKVNALRRRLDAAGLYGARSALITDTTIGSGLAPYLASLIVTEDPKAAGVETGAAFAASIFHSLRPYGGVACLPASGVSDGALKGWVAAAKLEGAEVKREGDYTLLVRKGPLPGAAAWTHQDADACNSLSSKDDLVKGPLGVLWFGGPSAIVTFDRHFRAPRPHVVGGREIILGPRGITAVDVYTGRVMWKAEHPETHTLCEPYRRLPFGAKVMGANLTGSSYVSLPDGIYVAGAAACVRLDPATGAKISDIALPAGGAMKAFGPIRIDGGVLVAAVDPIVEEGVNLFGPNRADGGASRHLAAFDRASGKMLWSIEAAQGFSHAGISVGGGKVFCLDRWGIDPKAEIPGGTLRAIDARTGTTVWQTGENVFGTWTGYSPETGVVLQGVGVWSFKNPHRSRGIAYRADDGTVLWDMKVGGEPWMLNGSALMTQGRTTMNILDGARGKSYVGSGFGKGCNYAIGSTHLLLKREGSAMYVDLDRNTAHRLGAFRSGCMNNLIAADGVLSCPYFATGCGCALNIRTSVGLIHMPELERGSKDREGSSN